MYEVMNNATFARPYKLFELYFSIFIIKIVYISTYPYFLLIFTDKHRECISFAYTLSHN